MCALARSVYMPLLTERDSLGIWSYKHVAPPEQTKHVAPPEQTEHVAPPEQTEHVAPPEQEPKHVAPPEQEPRYRMMITFRAKPEVMMI
jgi:hypothetical protein